MKDALLLFWAHPVEGGSAKGSLYELTSKDGWRMYVDVLDNAQRAFLAMQSYFGVRVQCLPTPRPVSECRCHLTQLPLPIRQFNTKSGRCWWTTMWFLVGAHDALREEVVRRLEKRRAGMGRLLEMMLCDGRPETNLNYSEELRVNAYHTFGIGFQPGSKSETRNGTTELSALLTQLGFRVATVSPTDAESVAGFADVVFADCTLRRWDAPLRLEELDLHGAAVGHGVLGHQLAAVKCPHDNRTWFVADSDAALRGIGVVTVTTPRELTWQEGLQKRLMMIKGQPIGPMNVTRECFKSSQGCDVPGQANWEYMYVRSRF